MAHNISSSKRDSSIELMRIVLMVFIVLLHYITNAKMLADASDSEFFAINTLRGFLLVAVNCFVMVSGYHGIRFKSRGLLNLYFICFFYGTIFYFLHLLVDHQSLGASVLYNSLFCISHSKLWFIPCYFALYCLSPILNKAIEGTDKKEHLFILAILTLFNVYFGFFWKNIYFSNNGFSIAQMVYMYFVGAFIGKYYNRDKLANKRIRLVAIYVAFVLVWSVIALVHHNTNLPHWGTNCYNNPFIIGSSICFFLLFLSIKKFHNDLINKMAKGVLAVYVIHMGAYSQSWFEQGIQFIYKFIPNILAVQLLTLCILSIITVVVIAAIDQIRIRLFSAPIEALSNRIDNAIL